MALGRYAESLAANREAMDIFATPLGAAGVSHDPDFPASSRLRIYRCLMELGRRDEAEAAMAAYRAGPPVSPALLDDLAAEEARAGLAHGDHAMAWFRMAAEA